MIGERDIKPYFDYKEGAVVVSSAYSPEPAAAAQIFIIQTFLSSNKDVLYILTISEINAETPHHLEERR